MQGFGGPCCARILTTWFATKERGTYWGMWNIAHNLGGFLAPIVAGTAARMYGWKYGVFVCAECIALRLSLRLQVQAGTPQPILALRSSVLGAAALPGRLTRTLQALCTARANDALHFTL